MEAERLKQVDMDYRNHLQAFLNFVVKAEKKAGKGKIPVYRKFIQFFDYDREIDRARAKNQGGEKGRFSGIGKFFRKGE